MLCQQLVTAIRTQESSSNLKYVSETFVQPAPPAPNDVIERMKSATRDRHCLQLAWPEAPGWSLINGAARITYNLAFSGSDALKKDAAQESSADTKRKPAEQAALIDRLSTSVEQVNTERAKPAFGNRVTNDPIALNVDALSECRMAIITYMTIRPDTIFQARRELLRRIRIRFDEEGIEITVSHLKLLQYEDASDRSCNNDTVA